MLKPFRLAALLALCQLAACAGTPVNPNQLPSSLNISRDISLPVNGSLGLYIPAAYVQYTEMLRGQLSQRGRYTRDGIDAVARHFFSTVVHYDRNSAEPVQRMLVLQPKWSAEAGKVKLELSYRLYDAGARLLASGSKDSAQPLDNSPPDVMMKNLAIRTMQGVMVEILNTVELKGGAQALPIAQFPPQTLINEEKPMRIGTGFYLNREGQLLATASATDGCLRLDVGEGEAKRSGRVSTRSPLLNLAVIDTGAPAAAALAVATARPELGATTTALGYARNKDNAPSRTLSFGNVAGFDGVAGATGVFQFSTATMPPTYGGPVVGPDGKLIGVFSVPYNFDYLHKQNLLPANTYESLTAEVVTTFLRRSRVAYSTEAYADTLSAVDRTTAATVLVACYQ
ncbi:MAG: S1 family peptidase [Solimonas sp.]